jgi:hypothetical protein
MCLLMRIRKPPKRPELIGRLWDATTSAKRRWELDEDSYFISSSVGAAEENQESSRQLQLQNEFLIGESSSQISNAMNRSRNYPTNDSTGQKSIRRFQQQQNDGGMQMTSASFEADTTSVIRRALDTDMARFRFGSDLISMMSTDVAHGGIHQSYQHQQLLNYQHQELGSPAETMQMDMSFPRPLYSSVATISESLNILPATWDTHVTGSPLHGDDDTSYEQTYPVPSPNTGGAGFRYPTKVAIRHSALIDAVPRFEASNQSLQQEQLILHQAQQTDPEKPLPIGGSLSFHLPLCSDLEPTPFPP